MSFQLGCTLPHHFFQVFLGLAQLLFGWGRMQPEALAEVARWGRIGAEEIVETLNRVFGPMLHIAATRGGELLKFGGDALLFLFRGPDHPEQACDAAVEMRAL